VQAGPGTSPTSTTHRKRSVAALQSAIFQTTNENGRRGLRLSRTRLTGLVPGEAGGG
jgi:hypothetical protein